MTFRFVFLFVLSLNVFAISAGIIIYSFSGIDIFSEDGIITKLSVIQLVVIAWLSCNIFNTRRIKGKYSLWKNSAVVWLIISIGYLFLAADDLFLIHENIDILIHQLFNIQETALSDRIDDFLVCLYGMIGIGVLFSFRDELKSYKEAYPFFIFGFVIFFIMVLVDMLINRNDILPLIFHHEHAKTLDLWMTFAEDSLKVFAEAFFIIGFFTILQKAKRCIEAEPAG